MSLGRFDEAIASYREAIRRDPEDRRPYPFLGYALAQTGRTDEAFAQFRKAMATPAPTPETVAWWRILGIRAGRGDEIRLGWRESLDGRPFALDAWDGYAELCLFLGEPDEYRRARKVLLENVKPGGQPRDAERVGRACLLLPGSEEEMKRATALVDFAVESGRKSQEWTYWYFLFAKALADYRAGRFDEATAILKGATSKVLVPGPQVLLAMTQHRLGHREDALATLAATTPALDWRPTQVRDRETWIYQALRREAEALILPDLPALLSGDLQPQPAGAPGPHRVVPGEGPRRRRVSPAGRGGRGRSESVRRHRERGSLPVRPAGRPRRLRRGRRRRRPDRRRTPVPAGSGVAMAPRRPRFVDEPGDRRRRGGALCRAGTVDPMAVRGRPAPRPGQARPRPALRR